MNPKKSALGKGLSALLDNSFEETDMPEAGSVAGNVSSLPVGKIQPNPFQPRTDFDENAIRELAESIRQHGIIQPITVRAMGDGQFQIIAGERRWRASKLAGLDFVPAYTRVANDEGMLEMALVENIQRQDLNPIEIALSFQRLIDEAGLTTEQVAGKAGKDRTTVVNYLRLLKLPPLIQAAIREEKISMGHARAIINVEAVDLQLKIFKDIMAGNLSVRMAENMVRQGKGRKRRKAENKPVQSLSPEYRNIQDRLSGTYETKVHLVNRPDGSGHIQISYYSTDDLNRLLDMLDA